MTIVDVYSEYVFAKPLFTKSSKCEKNHLNKILMNMDFVKFSNLIMDLK